MPGAGPRLQTGWPCQIAPGWDSAESMRVWSFPAISRRGWSRAAAYSATFAGLLILAPWVRVKAVQADLRRRAATRETQAIAAVTPTARVREPARPPLIAQP